MLKRRFAQLTSAVACAVLLFGCATPALARTRKSCREHIRHVEKNLRAAVRKHGEHSQQAEKRRRELEKVRAECHM